ncbi:MAG: DmsC/YnfH family molybdoenzyme membrane anchor subunit [Thiohalomonadales bacterium]
MFKVRSDEPEYAFIPDVEVPKNNRWGESIDTVDSDDSLVGKSLNINGDNSVGNNPNRYKQHGFHFSADNCIGCHACEAACSEKNDLPAHISFRSVGYVEGGTYPDYRRLNISMACNHCDNPVCLKGCPTRAYTKYAEYGAVLQDPDICFGCGYCTWVCPYNAPQLDPIKGQVSKCNMCVDRLEVGLKPACAAACLGGALDFGIIDSKPENREQMNITIPGFPTPDITHPNIRFEQKRSLPREMTRPDTMPIRYQHDEQGQGQYKTKAALNRKSRQWNLSKLRSREDPLVKFTLITQAVIGAFSILFLLPILGLNHTPVAQYESVYGVFLFALLGLQAYGLFTSTMHLGKPQRFYRAFNNLRYSPVSREVAAVAVFFNALAAYTVLHTFPQLLAFLPTGLVTGLTAIFGWLALVAGPIALYAMHKIYRIEARPYWNHWQVLTAFFGTTLSLGALSVAVVYVSVSLYHSTADPVFEQLLAYIIALGLVIELIGLLAHQSYLRKTGGEATAAHVKQTTEFGYSYLARNCALVVGLALLLLVLTGTTIGLNGYLTWYVLALILLPTAIIGRALFYVIVVPTTMPGAFFWKNQGFQEHARETGLADMPQVGVVPLSH